MIRVALILLAMCAPAVARPLDNGGYIHDYVHRIIAASGQRHEIRGDCVSAFEVNFTTGLTLVTATASSDLTVSYY